MKASNWPGGVDYGHSNWTLKHKRTDDWGGAWEPGTHRIPVSGYIGGAAVVALLIALLYIGFGAGF